MEKPGCGSRTATTFRAWAAEAPDDKALWHKLEGLIPELLSLNEVRTNPNREIEVVLNFHPRKERIQLTNAA